AGRTCAKVGIAVRPINTATTNRRVFIQSLRREKMPGDYTAGVNLITQLFDVVLHLREHIGDLITQFGPQIYTIFFVVIFCETGLVFTPFLPGDSLLFTAGAFAALGQLNVGLMFAILSAAAILGDTANYWIGHYLGPKVFKWKKSRFFNPEHL